MITDTTVRVRGGVLNVLWFGASTEPSTDSSAAVNAALAALPPASGGEIFFPAGTYTFAAPIVYNFPTTSGGLEFSLSFVGSGADISILYWPANNGIGLNLGSRTQSFHFRDLSITTGHADEYTGVILTQTAQASGVATGQSDFTRVTFRGASPQLQWWDYAIFVTGIININYTGMIIAGSLPSVGEGGGVAILGVPSTPLYALVHNFTDCTFYSGDVGIYYGTYVQGVTVSQCNFGNSIGILVPTGASSQAQLTVVGSQFGCPTCAIDIGSPVGGVSIIGNAFFFPTPSSSFVAIKIQNTVNVGLDGIAIQGNSFNETSINGTEGKGITVSSTYANGVIYGVVTANAFTNMQVAIDLTGANLWNVQANVYSVTIPTQVIPGTGNTVGIATK